MNTANKLTMLRVILIPIYLVIWHLDFSWNYIVALAIFGFAIANMIISILENGIYYKYNLIMNKIYRKEW